MSSARIIPPSFLRKAEKCKEREGTKNVKPATEFDRGFPARDVTPDDGWVVVYAGKIYVRIHPSPPRADAEDSGVPVKNIAAQSDGAEAAESSEAHETDVSMAGQVGVGEELVVLFAALVEGQDAENCDGVEIVLRTGRRDKRNKRQTSVNTRHAAN